MKKLTKDDYLKIKKFSKLGVIFAGGLLSFFIGSYYWADSELVQLDIGKLDELPFEHNEMPSVE